MKPYFQYSRSFQHQLEAGCIGLYQKRDEMGLDGDRLWGGRLAKYWPLRPYAQVGSACQNWRDSRKHTYLALTSRVLLARRSFACHLKNGGSGFEFKADNIGLDARATFHTDCSREPEEWADFCGAGMPFAKKRLETAGEMPAPPFRNFRNPKARECCYYIPKWKAWSVSPAILETEQLACTAFSLREMRTKFRIEPREGPRGIKSLTRYFPVNSYSCSSRVKRIFGQRAGQARKPEGQENSKDG